MQSHIAEVHFKTTEFLKPASGIEYTLHEERDYTSKTQHSAWHNAICTPISTSLIMDKITKPREFLPHNSTFYKTICHKGLLKRSSLHFFKRDPTYIYFMEMYCSKQESPEFSKYFTSQGPSITFCQDEEAKKEPPARGGWQMPHYFWPERLSQLLTALPPPARPLRDNDIRDNYFLLV